MRISFAGKCLRVATCNQPRRADGNSPACRHKRRTKWERSKKVLLSRRGPRDKFQFAQDQYGPRPCPSTNERATHSHGKTADLSAPHESDNERRMAWPYRTHLSRYPVVYSWVVRGRMAPLPHRLLLTLPARYIAHHGYRRREKATRR
jgi:hypothetical protein